MQPKRLVYEFGAYRVDQRERLLRRGHDVVPLPPKAMDLLLVLLEHPGEAVSKDALLQRVWAGTFVEEGSLAQSISLLRKALAESESSRFIETIPRRGYRFVATVREQRNEPEAQAIAVLPLANLSGDSSREFFADGMTDELIGCLMKIGTLRVAPRTSAMAYKGTSRRVRDIARELDVDWVIEGAVLQSGDRIRITVHLIEAATESQRWAEAYERDLRDVLTLQSELAGEIGRRIRANMATPERGLIAVSRRVDPESYDAYLRGRHFLNKRFRDDLRRAVDYFTAAIDRDPTYAPAHAGLADSYALLSTVGYDVLPPRDGMPRARAAARAAVQLDPSMAQAHASLGYISLSYEWDFAVAHEHFGRALACDPAYSTTHLWHGHCLFAEHRLDDAGREMRRALELDPLSVPCSLGVGWSLYYARRFDDAIAQYRKTLEIAPHLPMALYELGLSYQNKGDYEHALTAFQQGYELSGAEAASRMLLGHLFALLGRTEESHRHLSELCEQAKRQYVPSLYIAFVYVGLRDHEAAFAWFDKAFEERCNYLVYLGVEPSLDEVRGDSRFIRLMRRVALELIA